MRNVSIIVAVDKNWLIGRRGGLPWRLPADLRHFKSVTTGHTVIMGRKTYESIGKPLPNRFNIVITKQKGMTIPGCEVVDSAEEALRLSPEKREIFVIGGAEIYSRFLPLVDKIYLTRIDHSFEGDIFFPEINMSEWKEIEREDMKPDEKNPYPYSFIVIKKTRK